jgi:hypothetical protein
MEFIRERAEWMQEKAELLQEIQFLRQQLKQQKYVLNLFLADFVLVDGRARN